MNRVTNAQLAEYHHPKKGDKYSAQHITFRTKDGDVYRFDSRFELNVFQLLRPIPRVVLIEKDHRVMVLPQTQHFPQRNWRIDFRLETTLGFDIFLECKSQATALHADFRRTLENLSYFKPEVFQKLLIVLPDSNQRDLGKISKYLRVPVYPEGIFQGAVLLTASELKAFLWASTIQV